MLLLKPKENDFYVLLRESADQVVKSSNFLVIDNPHYLKWRSNETDSG